MTTFAVTSSIGGPFGNNAAAPQFKQREQDFQKLESAIKNGDMDSAKQAFDALQKDHPKGMGPPPGGGQQGQQDNNPLSKDMQALGNAINTGDVSGAQKALSTLQQDAQSLRKAQGGGQHHHRRHMVESGSTADAAQTTSSPPTEQTGGNTLNVTA